jgi:DNA-cytosine methyltransferase
MGMMDAQYDALLAEIDGTALRVAGNCPAHGPHKRRDRVCPRCWESDFERQNKPVLNVLDLFSGIGGISARKSRDAVSLGLERAGMRTVAFCEIEPYCRAVLRKHWPNVPCYDDVRTLTADRLEQTELLPDVICGGFPCQDISIAGKGAGIEGERSGLWKEYARIIGELRPRYVIVENVAALLGRGLGRVLGDLAALGYDAEWHCIPASAVGAPHRRDRLWLVAYPQVDLKRRRATASCAKNQSLSRKRKMKPKGYVIGFTTSQRLIGPFKTALEAAKYGEKEYPPAGNYEWRVIPIKPPYQ